MIVTPPPINLPTNRKFGWFFATVFAAIGVWLFWRLSTNWAFFFVVLSVVFAFITFAASHLLEPLNRFWYGLGMLLGRIISPIVLGLIFFVLITPVSLITRLFGRDELRIKKRSVSSYWVDRIPPGPPSDSFKNQY